MTYANGVHSRVGEYVAQCMRDADDCFTGATGKKEVHGTPPGPFNKFAFCVSNPGHIFKFLNFG